MACGPEYPGSRGGAEGSQGLISGGPEGRGGTWQQVDEAHYPGPLVRVSPCSCTDGSTAPRGGPAGLDGNLGGWDGRLMGGGPVGSKVKKAWQPPRRPCLLWGDPAWPGPRWPLLPREGQPGNPLCLVVPERGLESSV